MIFLPLHVFSVPPPNPPGIVFEILRKAKGRQLRRSLSLRLAASSPESSSVVDNDAVPSATTTRDGAAVAFLKEPPRSPVRVSRLEFLCLFHSSLTVSSTSCHYRFSNVSGRSHIRRPSILPRPNTHRVPDVIHCTVSSPERCSRVLKSRL